MSEKEKLYREALQAEIEKAMAEIERNVTLIKKALSFDANPALKPRSGDDK